MLPLHRTCSGELYRTLGVPPTCSEAEIKQAYHQKALLFHPDKSGGNPDAAEKFKDVQEAHSILMDPQQRKLYNTFGREGLKRLASMGGEGYGSVMAENPRILAFLAVGVWFLSVDLLVFVGLVCAKIDKNKDWDWDAVFTPIWVAAVIFLIPVLLMIWALIRNRQFSLIPSIVNAALQIAICICVSKALDGEMVWSKAFLPIFLSQGFFTAITVVFVRLSVYKKYLAMTGAAEAEEITWTNKGYLTYLGGALIGRTAWLSFVILLYLRVTEVKGYEHMSFYLIALPLLIRLSISLGFSTKTIFFDSNLERMKEKVCAVIFLLIAYGGCFYTLLMCTAKMQQLVNDGNNDGISAGACAIFIFIALFITSVIAFCGCFMIGQPAPDESMYSATDFSNNRYQQEPDNNRDREPLRVTVD